MKMEDWMQLSSVLAGGAGMFKGGVEPRAAEAMARNAASVAEQIARRKMEKEKEREEAGALGGRLGSTAGSVLGSALGFAVGGPAGAVIGGGLGGAAGGSGGQALAGGDPSLRSALGYGISGAAGSALGMGMGKMLPAMPGMAQAGAGGATTGAVPPAGSLAGQIMGTSAIRGAGPATFMPGVGQTFMGNIIPAALSTGLGQQFMYGGPMGNMLMLPMPQRKEEQPAYPYNPYTGLR